MAAMEGKINEAFKEVDALLKVQPYLVGQEKDRMTSIVNNRFDDIVRLSRSNSASTSTTGLLQRFIELRNGSSTHGAKLSGTISGLISQLEKPVEVPMGLALKKSCHRLYN